MSDRKVRVRFAPSPTGPLHIGGVRTALYNYLFAKRHKGDMILRIEDTDQTRYVPGAEDYIMESLEWCGIKIDEGIREGGNCGPYRQSERKAMYKSYADQLIESGNAYYAFDTSEEMEALRKKLEAEKADNLSYSIFSRSQMKNSLSLPKEEVERLLSEGHPYVIRFKMPENTDVFMHDEIRNDVKVNTNTLDDKVLYKSDGMPTYHLANVVDDHLMDISHVIRGEEWLPSLPLHVLLYKAFGWEESMPKFAHLPLLLKPEGNGKLSKRDGDRLGFPVFPLQWTSPTNEVSSGYRESGYFPEAFINMIALLGWNPGNDQEFLDMEALIASFSLDRVTKSGARFDIEKAKMFNQHYLRTYSDEHIAKLFSTFLTEKGLDISYSTLLSIIPLVKERVNFINELWDQTSFFFISPQDYDAKVIKKRWKEGMNENIIQISKILNSLEDFTETTAHDAVIAHIEQNELNMGQIMNCLRLCLVGAGKGPDLFKIAIIIGKEETINRLNKGANTINR
ncbi:MAG: glutamate--tRNA ligase [Bacteroidales bacterium]|nr:glutamate--tRNA ligase [Bacteroidales bacterium]